MAETKKAETVFSKMVQVMAEVESVNKNGRNEFQHYDYATEADILTAIRGSLIKHKLLILPSVESIQVNDSGLTSLLMKFQIIDAETGQSIERGWVGTGHDKLDKGAYKALTGAVKYFLLKTFLISTNDDPERDTGTSKADVQEDQEDASKPPQNESQILSSVKKTCGTCGAEAVERKGVSKAGKNYHGIFCSTTNSTHTEWL